MANMNIGDHLQAAITQAFTQTIEHAFAEEEERAVERLRQRIQEVKASIVMSVLKQYDVSRDRSEVIIRVRDTTQP